MDIKSPERLRGASNQLEIKIIKSLVELMECKDAWNNFLRQNNNDNPFIEFDWIEKWWSFLGEGHSMFVISILKDGNYIGFCPLMITKKGIKKELNFIGYPQASYMDFVLTDQHREACINLVLSYLLGLRGNYIINLHGIIESSPNLNIFKDCLKKNNVHFLVRRTESPFIKIDKKFQDYYKERLRHNSLKMMKSREKRLMQLGKITYEKLEAERIDEIFRLHDKRWKNKRDTSNFSKESLRAFFKELALQRNLSFTTSVTVLKLEERIIAFNYSFVCNGKYAAYRVAHDDDFSIFSAGKIIIKEVIKECFENGIGVFDFGLGDIGYKHEWADEKEGINKFIFPVSNKTSGIIFRIGLLKERLYNTLKKNQGIVNLKEQVFDIAKVFISRKNLKGLLNRAKANIKNKGLGSIFKDFFKKSWSSIYSTKEYIIYEKELDGSLSHQTNNEAEGYEITEANLKDLDELCEVTREETAKVVNRFYKKQRCFTLRQKGSIAHCFWVDTNNIELPAINYKEPLEKGKACITKHTTTQRHKNLDAETQGLTHILNTLSQEGFTKCIIPVERKNLTLKNSIEKAGFTPNGFIKYKRLFMNTKTSDKL